MNRIFISFIILLGMIISSACTQKKNMIVQPIAVESPERPAGQEDVIQLIAPKIDTVRIGFIGLGMRGPAAVSRYTLRC